MELKDIILSTLAELENEDDKTKEIEEKLKVETKKEEIIKITNKEKSLPVEETTCETLDDERYFCESMKERILVLFEGFQSPSNKNIEAKIDLTLNFLEYSLAILDKRLEKLDNR
ncbi:MAG: hypothetical protein JJV95_01890 [Sulfurospirillum sp.]|nr:hypothetical protein [Sulfurospirillum sp.]MBL0702722.1 hypothetical protein [Sulfurospirillum sp.]